ncbi:uncharacterized protein LOC105204499 [Solenopsis invicta]|nr:uncharacterized protein LOC105204499 [Solenopsis invicta]
MSNSPSQIFLSTVLADAKDCQGRRQTCRILLDPGSQSHLVTEDLVRRLGLTTKSVNISISGVNQTLSKAQKQVQIQISSRHYEYKVTIDCLVSKRIIDPLPTVTMDKNHFKIPSNLALADPAFYRSTDVDILLGAEVFWKILCVGQIEESSDHPLLQKTLFGWIIGVERFWQTEQVSLKPVLTEEERQYEKQFKQTYRRTELGRFVVQLPIKEDKLSTLGHSYETALKRFHSLERKLNRNPEMKREYTQFIHEYRQLKHMHLATLETKGAFPAYYMPHHAVFKATSSTTRIRVVFDASCKTDTGTSLNDILMVGPPYSKISFPF